MYIPVKERHYVESLQALDEYRVLDSNVFKWLDTLTKDTNVILGEQYGKQFKMHCTHCGHDYCIDTKPKLKQTLECPHCHEIFEYHRMKYSYTAKTNYVGVHILQEINGVIYSRYFYGDKRIHRITNKYTYFLKETKRKRIDSDWTLRYSDSSVASNKLIPENPNFNRRSYSYYACDYQENKGWLYPSGVKEMFENTKYKYSAIELISGHPVDIKPFEYLEQSIKYPEKERLAKMGYYNLASEYIRGAHEVLLKILIKLDKKKRMVFRDFDISFRQIENAILCECETLEEIELACSIELYHHYGEIRRFVNKKKLYEYVRLNNDCASYKDYLDWCDTLGENMTDNKILFPKNLKKVHDQKMKQCETIKDEVINRKIAAYATELSPLKFENKKLIIRPVTSQDELIVESKMLNHCVKSYGITMAERRTSIFVIREKATPDEPLVTLELKKNNVVQVRAKNNNVPPKQVQAFVKQWEKQFQLQGY